MKTCRAAQRSRCTQPQSALGAALRRTSAERITPLLGRGQPATCGTSCAQKGLCLVQTVVVTLRSATLTQGAVCCAHQAAAAAPEE
eukprot:356295-Chlamydomonas_euryale.AAC.26